MLALLGCPLGVERLFNSAAIQPLGGHDAGSDNTAVHLERGHYSGLSQRRSSRLWNSLALLDTPASKVALHRHAFDVLLEATALTLSAGPVVLGPQLLLGKPSDRLQVRRGDVDAFGSQALDHDIHDSRAKPELAGNSCCLAVPVAGHALLGRGRDTSHRVSASSDVRRAAQHASCPHVDGRHVRLTNQVEREVASLGSLTRVDLSPRVEQRQHGIRRVHAVQLSADLADLLLGRVVAHPAAVSDVLGKLLHVFVEITPNKSSEDVDRELPVRINRRIGRGSAKQVSQQVTRCAKLSTQHLGDVAIPVLVAQDDVGVPIASDGSPVNVLDELVELVAYLIRPCLVELLRGATKPIGDVVLVRDWGPVQLGVSRGRTLGHGNAPNKHRSPALSDREAALGGNRILHQTAQDVVWDALLGGVSLERGKLVGRQASLCVGHARSPPDAKPVAVLLRLLLCYITVRYCWSTNNVIAQVIP